MSEPEVSSSDDTPAVLEAVATPAATTSASLSATPIVTSSTPAPTTSTTETTTTTEPAKTTMANDSSQALECGMFEYRGDPMTIGQRWNNWLERFELAIVGADIKDNARIKAKFLLMMGPDAMEIYKAKRKVENDESVAEAKALMTKEFVVAKSELTEVCIMRRAMKHKGERVKDYMMRLRLLAADCKFGTGIDSEIMRQFIVGCDMPDVQRKCCREKTLTLDSVLDIAIGYERVALNFSGLHKPTEREQASRVEVNQVSESTDAGQRQHYSARHTGNKGSTSWADRQASTGSRGSNRHAPGGYRGPSSGVDMHASRSSCGSCGHSVHENGSQCPARGASCNRCGGKDHYARVCTQKQRDKQQPHNGNKTQSQTQQRSGRNRSFNHVETDAVGSRTVEMSAEEYADYSRYMSANKSLYVVEHASVNALEEDYLFITAKTLDTHVRFLVDSGAPINTIDESLYESLKPRPLLDPCPIEYYG